MLFQRSRGDLDILRAGLAHALPRHVGGMSLHAAFCITMCTAAHQRPSHECCPYAVPAPVVDLHSQPWWGDLGRNLDEGIKQSKPDPRIPEFPTNTFFAFCFRSPDEC